MRSIAAPFSEATWVAKSTDGGATWEKPVQIAPLAASNGVGTLANEIAYMQANASGFSGVSLVPGTEPFNAAAAGGGAVLKVIGL